MRISGRKPRPSRLAALSALLVFAILPMAVRRAAAGPPKGDITLSLKEKVIRDLSSSGLTLSFRILVANRASTDLALVRYRYRVLVNQREFLNMAVGLDEPLTIPAGRDTLISLPVKVSYNLLVEAVGPVGEKALCDVVGEMFFADERRREDKVGFAYPGEFPIFKDPEVELLPLQVNDLTVGGADVVFRSRFRNLNPYELVVERIAFRLLFGDKEVLSGDIPGDKSLPASGERMFALPFIIDFFEAGREMRDLFQKGEVPARFEGEVEISSAWGRLLIPFDKAQAVPAGKRP